MTTPSPCPYATTDHPDIAEWKRTQHENSKGMSHRNSRPSYQALGSFQNDRNQVPADQNQVTAPIGFLNFWYKLTKCMLHHTDILTYS